MEMLIAYLVFFGLYLLSPEFKTRKHRRRSRARQHAPAYMGVTARLYIEPYSTQSRRGKRFVVRKLSGEWPRNTDLILLCRKTTGFVEAVPQYGKARGIVELSMFASVRFVTIYIGTKVHPAPSHIPRQPWN